MCSLIWPEEAKVTWFHSYVAARRSNCTGWESTPLLTSIELNDAKCRHYNRRRGRGDILGAQNQRKCLGLRMMTKYLLKVVNLFS